MKVQLTIIYGNIYRTLISIAVYRLSSHKWAVISVKSSHLITVTVNILAQSLGLLSSVFALWNLLHRAVNTNSTLPVTASDLKPSSSSYKVLEEYQMLQQKGEKGQQSKVDQNAWIKHNRVQVGMALVEC